jgi:hypothetical protein
VSSRECWLRGNVKVGCLSEVERPAMVILHSQFDRGGVQEGARGFLRASAMRGLRS